MLMKILLADDDIDDRFFFSDFLKHRQDIEILASVTDGFEVINYLDQITGESNYPNLIVLDQNMPKLNGRETLQAIRKNEKYKGIAVVVYSTYMDQNLIDECSCYDVASVYTKPFSLDGYNQMMDDIMTSIR